MYIHKQQTNLWMKLPTIPAHASGQDHKKPPALETNQIGGFGGFRRLASLEKKEIDFYSAQTKALPNLQ